MARELALEQDCVDYAEAQGFVSRKMVYAGRRGCRDRDFYGFGHILPVEFKRKGKPLDAHQDKERRRLAEAGVKVHVVDDYEAFVALVDKARANPVRSIL